MLRSKTPCCLFPVPCFLLVPRPWLLAALLLFIIPALLEAQAIRGQVVDASTGAPVSQANVVVFGDGGSALVTLADEDGNYQMRLPSAGVYLVQASRQGYRPTTADSLLVQGSVVVDVPLIELQPQPVVLDEVTATGRLGRLTPGREWVRQRQLLGKGTFFSGAMLARLNPSSLTRHLATETNLWVSFDERGYPVILNKLAMNPCVKVLVNEWPMNREFEVDGFKEVMGYASLDEIPLESIAAVEVYNEMRDVPAGRLWFDETGAHPCGVINVWTWDSY